MERPGTVDADPPILQCLLESSKCFPLPSFPPEPVLPSVSSGTSLPRPHHAPSTLWDFLAHPNHAPSTLWNLPDPPPPDALWDLLAPPRHAPLGTLWEFSSFGTGRWFVSTGKDNLLNAWRTPYGASIFQVH